MECIRSLVAEIDVLRADHAALMQERRDARDQATKLADKFRAKCEKVWTNYNLMMQGKIL